MLEEFGTVVEDTGEYAQVEIARKSACGGCSDRGGCGTSIVERLFERRTIRVRALNRIGAGSGERVVVGLTHRSLVQSSLAAYLVPVLALIFGAVSGRQLGQGEAGEGLAAIGAVTGLLLSLVWLARFARRRSLDPVHQATVLRREPSLSAAACSLAQVSSVGPKNGLELR